MIINNVAIFILIVTLFNQISPASENFENRCSKIFDRIDQLLLSKRQTGHILNQLKQHIHDTSAIIDQKLIMQHNDSLITNPRVELMSASQYLRLIYKAFYLFEKEAVPQRLFSSNDPQSQFESEIFSFFLSPPFVGPLPDELWNPRPAIVSSTNQPQNFFYGLIGSYRVLVTNDLSSAKQSNAIPYSLIGFKPSQQVNTFHDFYQKISGSLKSLSPSDIAAPHQIKDEPFVFFIMLTDAGK